MVVRENEIFISNNVHLVNFHISTNHVILEI